MRPTEYLVPGVEVVFKQRVARHLSSQPKLSWEYAAGTLGSKHPSDDSWDVCWLQGHSGRNDQVPTADIVAVHVPGSPRCKIGPFTGASVLLQPVSEEGAP